jgi:hypothetical protein
MGPADQSVAATLQQMGGWVLAAGVVGALLVTGCADEAAHRDGSPSSEAAAAADEAFIEAALLAPQDLPAEFENRGVTPQETDPPDDEHPCGPVDDRTFAEAQTAETGEADFVATDGSVHVFASIAAFESGEVPGRHMDALTGDEDALDCTLTAWVEDVESDGLDVSAIEPIDVMPPREGTRDAGFRARAASSTNDIEALVVHVLAEERFMIELIVVGVPGTIDARLAEGAIAGMVDRLHP